MMWFFCGEFRFDAVRRGITEKVAEGENVLIPQVFCDNIWVNESVWMSVAYDPM